MKFTGIALAGFVSCAAAFPPLGFFTPPPPQSSSSAIASSSATPSPSSIVARDLGEPPVMTPSSSASIVPTGFPWAPFEKRQFGFPSSFTSMPIPTGLPFEKRQFYDLPSSSAATPSSTATPSATPSATPF
ncbi:hypothetical protein FE257_001294 [Aspergillus nanangensis]|uniref:Uncharacterized protein n=1 Tax=Aspergillus nanangensis TaxID=2582783 RepID=A0AAD4CFA7_ASPNN|nr:hypothetical protein FE257_001294 [Aspergillus nanangensis]